MILACHTLIYSDDADATRAFFRDVLGFPNVDAGTGDHNWLDLPDRAERAGRPPDGPMNDGSSVRRGTKRSASSSTTWSRRWSSFGRRGAEFSSGPDDHGYGIVAMVKVPGADDVQLYQPRHQTAYGL